jgi:IS5 family transposase
MSATLNNDDHATLLTIQNLLDGKDWDAETLDEIASILNEAGYTVNDVTAW